MEEFVGNVLILTVNQGTKNELGMGSFPKTRYVIPKLLLVLGLALLTVANVLYIVYADGEINFGSAANYAFLSLVIILAGALSLAASTASFLATARRSQPAVDQKSNRLTWELGKIIADTFFQNRALIAIVSVAYAIFFGLVDGVIIYQPGVNFALAYAANGIKVVVETCCGYPGWVPNTLVYFPAQHLGLQLLPLSLLLMVLISSLVALNLALLYRAAKLSRSLQRGAGKRSLGGLAAAAFGLFAGCPTCAAAFFLSMIAGSGATIISISLSQYQTDIVALTLPLLIGSIIWQAKGIRTILMGCSV